MRRVFVIFLILLFPLNVLALSMSVASMQPAGSMHAVLAPAHADAGGHVDTDVISHATSHAAGPADSQPICDVDPDEPPAGMDVHDWVSREARLQFVVLPKEPVSSLVPARRGLSPFPPIKPPPLA